MKKRAYVGSCKHEHRRKETKVQLYGILRRNGWASAEELEAAAKRSAEEGDKEGSGVRWIRSYVLNEESGDLGTFCVYEGDSPEAIRAHAATVPMPADEVIEIVDTVVVRPDPAPVAS
jgi:hypothetical protein